MYKRQAPHSGDWLLVLPITACGLRLEDEAVRIAVALRLGSELGSSHTCRCGSLVEATGVHGLVCKQAPSRVVRHHALNESISRAFSAAGIPVRKEPAGLVQRDGKRPDGCTRIPRRGGKPLAWDVTVFTTVADSYVTAASQSAGSVAQQVTDRKCQKYGELSAAYEFQPVAVETHGPMDDATVWFLSDLGRKISERSRVTRLMASFYFNGSVCSYNDSTRSFSTKPFQLKMGSTRSHSSLLLFSCF